MWLYRYYLLNRSSPIHLTAQLLMLRFVQRLLCMCTLGPACLSSCVFALYTGLAPWIVGCCCCLHVPSTQGAAHPGLQVHDESIRLVTVRRFFWQTQQHHLMWYTDACWIHSTLPCFPVHHVSPFSLIPLSLSHYAFCCGPFFSLPFLHNFGIVLPSAWSFVFHKQSPHR